MVATLVVFGLVCLAAAAAGGGLKAFAIELPVVNSLVGRAGLVVVGVLALGLAYVFHNQPTANGPATATNTQPYPVPTPLPTPEPIPGPTPGPSPAPAPAPTPEPGPSLTPTPSRGNGAIREREQIELTLKQALRIRKGCLDVKSHFSGGAGPECESIEDIGKQCHIMHDAALCDEILRGLASQ